MLRCFFVGVALPLLLLQLGSQQNQLFAFVSHTNGYRKHYLSSSKHLVHNAADIKIDTTTTIQDGAPTITTNKRIVLIRHGCTYMNEYLSKEGTRWGDPHFTDIFDDPADIALYRDSTLSPRGIRQAQKLCSRLAKEKSDANDAADSNSNSITNIIEEIELIACSPLTRALQTMEIALYPNIWPGRVPITALPQASERVYLISDWGTNKEELKKQYPIVDFDSDMESDVWWFTSDEVNNITTSTPTMLAASTTTYNEEWRPQDQYQMYATPGEREVTFNNRMIQLYDWLHARNESTIALICHWGVIDWLTGEDYDNCEIQVVDFNSLRRTGFMLSDAESDELFHQGERSVAQDEFD